MIEEILEEIKNSEAKLIAVSKTKPNEEILRVYNLGQRRFGENYVQEFVEKQKLLPADIEWHFIGHLQTNKVKMIAPSVHTIHSVDSLKLLLEINKCALRDNRIINVLLQIHIADEETKFGFSPEEIILIFETNNLKSLEGIKIVGVMGMATFTIDKIKVRKEFKTLKAVFDTLKEKFFRDDAYFKEVSMGMSDDYKLALQEGSTMIRIGSLIFGKRN